MLTLRALPMSRRVAIDQLPKIDAHICRRRVCPATRDTSAFSDGRVYVGDFAGGMRVFALATEDRPERVLPL
jgi:hypothetical protein